MDAAPSFDATHAAPSLGQFETKIAHFRAIEEEINAQASLLTVGYVRADARPLKQTLNAWLSKWIYMYTECLQERVRYSV